MALGRRALLELALLGGTGLALPRRAAAAPTADALQPWGEYPSEFAEHALAPERRAKQVLEIFLWGGISPWETFYAVDEPEYGRARGEMWWSFLDGEDSVAEVFERCYGAGRPLLVPFGRDANGTVVKLGPFIEPLRTRTDITDRMRLHVVSHDQLPHDVAIPLAVTGYRLGSPKIAGVGAAVQHYFQSREPSPEPYAYLIVPFGRKADSFFIHAAQAGQHPAYALPFTLHVHGKRELLRLLRRESLGSRRGAADKLLAHFSQAYKERLGTGESGRLVRAPGLMTYEMSLSVLERSDEIIDVFAGTEHLGPGPVTLGGLASESSETAAQLELAVHLLRRPGGHARQVTVVDRGFIERGHDFAYDTHYFHNRESGPMLAHALSKLVSLINKPGEKDPAKIDLDETMVVLNTEFGRTPWKENSVGRNHYPQAYVTVMFGGPIGRAQRGLVGVIDHKGRASGALTPASTRAAILAALGVNPLAPECYAVSDFPRVGGRVELARWIKETVIGHVG